MPAIEDVREDHKIDLATEVLNSGGTIRLRALGTSMLPSIWPGDVLVIESTVDTELLPGDIVLVARDDRFFVHRLIKRHGSRWITRGDAVPQNDPAARASELLGRVSAVHRKHRIVIPKRRISLTARTLAWLFCHWNFFGRVVLRVHSMRQNRNAFFDRFQEKPDCPHLEAVTSRFRPE
jgi:hypothetical protein